MGRQQERFERNELNSFGPDDPYDFRPESIFKERAMLVVLPSIKIIELGDMNLAGSLQDHLGVWSQLDKPEVLAGETVQFKYKTRHIDSGLVTEIVEPGATLPDWTAPNGSWWTIRYKRHEHKLIVKNSVHPSELDVVAASLRKQNIVHWFFEPTWTLRTLYAATPNRKWAEELAKAVETVTNCTWRIEEIVSTWEPK